MLLFCGFVMISEQVMTQALLLRLGKVNKRQLRWWEHKGIKGSLVQNDTLSLRSNSWIQIELEYKFTVIECFATLISFI